MKYALVFWFLNSFKVEFYVCTSAPPSGQWQSNTVQAGDVTLLFQLTCLVAELQLQIKNKDKLLEEQRAR